MKPRCVSVVAGVLLSLLALLPVRADDGWLTLSGTVWLDENADGIRQLSEPALPGASVVRTDYRGTGHRIYADERGRYTLGFWVYPERLTYSHMAAYYNMPGAEPVWLPWDDKDEPYTHYGCEVFRATEDHEITLNIRVVSNKHVHKDARRDSRIKSEFRPNWPIADGRFFGGGCNHGFSVTNSDGIPFWDAWQRYGLENVGYPISHRYVWRGFVTQAFENAILQWQPGKGVLFVNIFDELHDAGGDDFLRSKYSTPFQLSPSFDAGKSWDEVVRDRLTLLDANPAIKARYYAALDPLLMHGLPTSRVEDLGNVFVIRTQRTVFQQWKEDVPGAKAGEVTTLNAGEIATEISVDCEKPNVRCVHWFFPEEAVYRDRWANELAPLQSQHFTLVDRGGDRVEFVPLPAGFIWVVLSEYR